MIEETANPPAPPVSARTAALRVELTEAPPIPIRHRRRPRPIAWRSIAVLFLPYLAVAACIVAAVLLTRGAHR